VFNDFRDVLACVGRRQAVGAKEEGFRLYFSYDEDAELVVVGHFPTHLPNALT
jgi:hypothetical protein